MKTSFIMSVLVSLILVSVIYVVGPRNSISELETRVDNITLTITQLEASNTKLIASINDALNDQMAYVTNVQEQLADSIQTLEKNQSADLTSLNNDISTVESLVQSEAAQRTASIKTLTNNIDVIDDSLSDLLKEMSSLESDLLEEMSDLEAAVEDLEEEVSEGDLTAEITSTDDLEIDYGDDDFSGTIVVKVSNDTNDDIEDIELLLTFEADEDIPDVYSAALTGGSLTWTYEGQDDNTLYFSNYSVFDVDEDDYEKMTLTLTVYFYDGVDEDTEFDASVEIEDYNS
jgi:hypothetical protein